MLALSFDVLPRYIYSNRRQFLPKEHHMDRLFNENVLIVMRKGILRFQENGVPVELKAGEYYIQRAGLSQTAPKSSDTPNYFFVHFDGVFDKKGRLPLRGTYRDETIRPIIEAFRFLGNDAPNLEYEKLFYMLLSELARQQKDDSTAERIKIYILENYKKPIGLTEIGAQFFLTKNQIIYLFRNAYGKTPHRYLMDYRLDKACDFLVSTLRPVTEIADQVGFEDYSVFYRAFTAKYGVSPSEYREIKSARFFMPPPNERPQNLE